MKTKHLTKIIIIASLILFLLFGSSWVFNHINPWLSGAIIFGIILYLIITINKLIKSL